MTRYAIYLRGQRSGANGATDRQSDLIALRLRVTLLFFSPFIPEMAVGQLEAGVIPSVTTSTSKFLHVSSDIADYYPCPIIGLAEPLIQ